MNVLTAEQRTQVAAALNQAREALVQAGVEINAGPIGATLKEPMTRREQLAVRLAVAVGSGLGMALTLWAMADGPDWLKLTAWCFVVGGAGTRGWKAAVR